MSFRELRNFTEMLRALGYPRLVSIENFRTPNFKLVAEVLVWLLKRYDPDYDLSIVLDSEQDRVIFIKTASLFLIQKARIKVNPKKLYQADGYAVQELIKVASVLYGAVQHNQFSLRSDDAQDNINISTVASNINSKLTELRASRLLAAEIPEKGASLYDLLSKEVELREQRTTALARPLEIKDVEKSLKASVKAVEEEIKQTLHSLNNISSDESNLDVKIEKKKTELERQQKRLTQLQAVRPAYMDEYEKLENRLKQLYSLYVMKFRNLTHLEQVQHEYDKAEQDRHLEADMSLRRMTEKMREEEREKLAAAENLETAAMMESADMFSDEDDGQKKGPRVYGNITGAGLSDDDEEDDDDDDSLLSDEANTQMARQHERNSGVARKATRGDESDLSPGDDEHFSEPTQPGGNPADEDTDDDF